MTRGSSLARAASVLFANPAEAAKKLVELEALVDQRATALQVEVQTYYRLQAERRKLAPAEPAMTEAERQAARLIAERTSGAGGFGARQQALEGLSAEERRAAQAVQRLIPQHMSAELNVLLGQKKTVLEIRDFLSGEFEPVALADLMQYLRAQEKLRRRRS